MGWEVLLAPVVSGLIGGLFGLGGSNEPEPPPKPRTPIQPMGQNRAPTRQRRNPYADAAAAGGMQGSMDPGMIRLEAARSLRGGG